MPDPETLDRRPIATRNLRMSQAAAAWLARQGVSANAISVAGMVAGMAAGVVLAATAYATGWEQSAAWLLGALLIQLRLAANMFDGMVALQSGQSSPLGELYNEVPDRVSDAATLIGAGYTFGGNVELGYLAACVALFVAYVRAMGKSAGLPNEFCGPMAKQQRMFTVTVAAFYCGLTPLSWQPSWDRIGGPMALALALIIAGGIGTALRRLYRIAGALKGRVAG